MHATLSIGKHSFGVGDRFAHEAKAQLQAFILLRKRGIEVTPVWNKSEREHNTVGSEPGSVKVAANLAARELNWKHPYFVDADHIRLDNVNRYIQHCDFFTVDVADYIGRPGDTSNMGAFFDAHRELMGEVAVPGMEAPFRTTRSDLEAVYKKYRLAVSQAGTIHRHISKIKGAGCFVTEVSMDETDHAQTPAELLVILAMLADEGVPLQTIAPKFTGRFNKGVDYIGDLAQFEREFYQDLGVLQFAVQEFGLPEDLKLSIHSGSDKFSLYPIIRRALQERQAGVHIKTAGTTWLEELIGLAEAGGQGLELAKEIYGQAMARLDELCKPYAAVIDINPKKLPSPETVKRWSGEQFTAALRHDPSNKSFNPHLRQLLHVGYKIAAKMGERYVDMLDECQDSISRNVTENLYERHMKPLFG